MGFTIQLVQGFALGVDVLLYVFRRMTKEKSYVCALNFGDEAIKEFPLALDKEEEAEEKPEEDLMAEMNYFQLSPQEQLSTDMPTA